MSYTSIIHIGRDGMANVAGELRNSHLWSPMTWNVLSMKYRGYLTSFFGTESDADFQALWDMHATDQLTFADNVAMQLTFDNVLVRREDFARVADALEQCYSDNSAWVAGMRGWHIRGAAKAFQDALLDEDVIAIGFNGTSVSDGPLLGVHEETSVTVDGEEYEDVEVRPYNINVDQEHWFLDLGSIHGRDGQPPDPNPLPEGWAWTGDLFTAKVVDQDGRSLEMSMLGHIHGTAPRTPDVLTALRRRATRGCKIDIR